MNPEQLGTEVMKLSRDARAGLAERIILSLDVPSDEENLHVCVLEAEFRLKELREGRAKEIPAGEVSVELWLPFPKRICGAQAARGL